MSSPPPLLWRQKLQAPPRGLALARERGWLAAWDEQGWLYLFDRRGQPQAQQNLSKNLAAVCLSEDGSMVATCSRQGHLRCHHPDLSVRWEKHHDRPLVALACSPLGHAVAAADDRGHVLLFDAAGEKLGVFDGQRPLLHLAFIPEQTLVVGSADLGLVAAFDLSGAQQWRGAVVTHVGCLSINGAGNRILLACFSDGLLWLDETGKTRDKLPTPEPCRLVAQSYDGQRILIGGMNNQIFLLDHSGQVQQHYSLDNSLLALALDAMGHTMYTAQTDGSVCHHRLANSTV